jgi:hypothetical protein
VKTQCRNISKERNDTTTMILIPRFLCILVALVPASNAFLVIANKSALPTRSSRPNPKVLDRSLTTTTSTLSLRVDATVSKTTALLLSPNSILSANIPRDVWVFIVGIIPFGWATIEFWRRIAVGEPFGTTSDSIYIGKENAPSESRGRRVLDRGAFIVAYVLFGIAAAAIGITLYSVLTSPPMDITTIL